MRSHHKARAFRYRGFTLIEVLMTLAIVAILATISTASYVLYVVRGQLAQTLTDYDNIRTVVSIESRSTAEKTLHLGSQPGQVPPLLNGMLDTRKFNQLDNVTLQLVLSPAGTFTSHPNHSAYALIARAENPAGERRLRLLRLVLPHLEGDKLWLSERELYFPLDTGAATSTEQPSPTPANKTGWDRPEAGSDGRQWSAQARICISGTDAKPLIGLNAQVQIRVVQEVVGWNGQKSERQWLTQVPFTDGCANFSQGGAPKPVDGQEGVSAIRFEVNDVFYYWPVEPAVRWDGGKPVIRIEVPA